jgi:hypothetical protein
MQPGAGVQLVVSTCLACRPWVHPQHRRKKRKKRGKERKEGDRKGGKRKKERKRDREGGRRAGGKRKRERGRLRGLSLPPGNRLLLQVLPYCCKHTSLLQMWTHAGSDGASASADAAGGSAMVSYISQHRLVLLQ